VDALAVARDSGLIRPDEQLLVLLSGGADSVCLLDISRELGAEVSALHVNYGLRGADSDADEAHCRALCERIGVGLAVERVTLTEQGNLQEAARDARYGLAEERAGGDYAAAHTASDQAETVLYRLAVSPGRRALLGMEPRRGRLVRPLLEATHEDTRAWCDDRGLRWREDASNADPRFARARVRKGLLAALREVSPGAEHAVGETAAQLRDEAEVLDDVVAEAISSLGGPAVAVADLRALGPGLGRLVLRWLAEQAAGAPVALGRRRAEEVLALAEAAGGSRALDLGGGLRAISEYGTVRFARGGDPPVPDPVQLPVPGRTRFGPWQVEAAFGGGGDVQVDPSAIGSTLRVRAWREGDRMRPRGLGGSKLLSDLFTDRRVPRALRRSLPVFEVGDEIVWVAGVAVDERYARTGEETGSISLSARRP
jgi:tRNA(Ile)-lysidine synthase